MKPSRSGWFFLVFIIFLTGCGRFPNGKATPTLPPFPVLGQDPSSTPYIFTQPTPTSTALSNPIPTAAPSLTPTFDKNSPLATPLSYTFPTQRPQTTRTYPATTLTPLAPGARLDQLSEMQRLGNGILLYFTFSPDGQWLGLATRRGISLVNAKTLREVRFIATPGDTPLLAFSPDGEQLAAADRDSRVQLYETATGKKIYSLDNGALGMPLSLSFFDGGAFLAVGTSSEISVVWDTATGKMPHRWMTSGNTAMAASRDGVLMASSNWEGMIYLWKLADGRNTGALWSDAEILSMQYAPDGQTLLAGYGDNTAAIWRLNDGKLKHTLSGHTDRVVSTAISGDSRLAATGSWDNTICLWDMDSGELLHTLKAHTGRIVRVAFTADGEGVASYSEDGRLQFWSVAAGIPTRAIQDFAPYGNAVFKPDDVQVQVLGETLFTGAQDGWLRWWTPNGSLAGERLVHPVGISALSFSQDGQWLATGGIDGLIRLWEAGSLRLVSEFDGSESWINCLAFSPDGRWLAASSAGGTIRLWDLTNGRPADRLETGDASVLRLAFSPDSRSLATGSLDGGIVLYRLNTSQPPRTLREKGAFVSALAFSPDGQTLATGGDEKKISLWRLGSDTLTFTPEGKRSEGLASLAFSPDGQMLATAFWDRSLRFYSPTGGLLRSFDLPFNARQIAFSADGRRLALSLDDGTVRIWGIR